MLSIFNFLFSSFLFLRVICVLNFVALLVKPLEGGPARKLAGQQKPPPPPENTATVLYVGRIPHGFYEKEMEGACFWILLHDFCGVCAYLCFL